MDPVSFCHLWQEIQGCMVRSWGWLLTLSVSRLIAHSQREQCLSLLLKETTKLFQFWQKTKYQNLSGSSTYAFLPVLHEGRLISFTGIWTRLIYVGIKDKTIITLRSKMLGLLVSAKTGPIYQKQPFILPRTNLGQWEFFSLHPCSNGEIKHTSVKCL